MAIWLWLFVYVAFGAAMGLWFAEYDWHRHDGVDPRRKEFYCMSALLFALAWPVWILVFFCTRSPP